MDVRAFKEISEIVNELYGAIEEFTEQYRVNEKKDEATFYGKLESFYDERYKIIQMLNTLEIKTRETLGFIPNSMVDLMKLREELKKLKQTVKAEKIYGFRELSFSFLDRLEKGLKTKDPLTVLVRERKYDELQKMFKSAINKLKKHPSHMVALQYLCEKNEFISVKDLAGYMNKAEKNAREDFNALIEALGLLLDYDTIGKEIYIRPKPILIAFVKEVGENEL